MTVVINSQSELAAVIRSRLIERLHGALLRTPESGNLRSGDRFSGGVQNHTAYCLLAGKCRTDCHKEEQSCGDHLWPARKHCRVDSWPDAEWAAIPPTVGDMEISGVHKLTGATDLHLFSMSFHLHRSAKSPSRRGQPSSKRQNSQLVLSLLSKRSNGHFHLDKAHPEHSRRHEARGHPDNQSGDAEINAEVEMDRPERLPRMDKAHSKYSRF
jgi:hypothetical protein